MAIRLIDTIKPANGGGFPIVEAEDVKVDENTRLDEALLAINEALAAIGDVDTSEDGVIFTADLQTTCPIGNYSSASANNPLTIAAEGKTLREVWNLIFLSEQNPTVTSPAWSAFINVSGTAVASTSDVIGAIVTPQVTLTFNPGAYQFDDGTGVEVTALTVNGTTYTLTNNAVTVSLENVTLSSTAQSIPVSVVYSSSQGSMPHTNLGNDYAAGRIEAVTDETVARNQSLTGSGNLAVTKPTVTVSMSPSSISQNEVGETVSINYSFTINNQNGAYPYGTTQGVRGTSASAGLSVLSRAKIVDGVSSPNLDSGTISGVTLGTAAQTKTVAATIAYAGSTLTPVSQYGNLVPSAKIGSGSDGDSKSVTVPAGYRKIFWGYAENGTIDSALIRGLAGSRKNGGLTNVELAENATASKIIIAAPKDTRTLTSVIMPSSLNANVTNNFIKQTSSVMVEGANGFAAAEYDVWVYAPAQMAGTYKINMV